MCALVVCPWCGVCGGGCGVCLVCGVCGVARNKLFNGTIGFSSPLPKHVERERCPYQDDFTICRVPTFTSRHVKNTYTCMHIHMPISIYP